MPDYRTSKNNKYGILDLTAYNAIELTINDKHIIQLGGNKFVGRGKQLTKKEAIEMTEKMLGVSIHRNTWLKWEEQELIPDSIPDGKYRFFPGYTPYHACASWTMMHGLTRHSPVVVRESRATALKIGLDVLVPFGVIKIDDQNPEFDPELINYSPDTKRILAYLWMRYRLLAEAGLNPQDDSIMIGIIKKAKESPQEPDKYILRIK